MWAYMGVPIKSTNIQIWTAVVCNITYHSAINSTSAWNKQPRFVMLSHHQKCTLIGEITGLYFSWIVDKHTKKYLTISACGRFSNSFIGLLFALVYSQSTMKDISITFLVLVITWYYFLKKLMDQNILTSSSVIVMKTPVCHLVNTRIYFLV